MKRTIRAFVAAMLLSLTFGLEAFALTTTLDPSNALYDPANSVANYGVDLGGVAKLTINGSKLCSGALLSTQRHILTAAHCVTNSSGVMNVSSLSATLLNGAETISGAAYYVAPNWNGSLSQGNDLAIIQLATTSSAAGYSIFRNASVTGALGVVLAGYGASGTGATGTTIGAGTLRVGMNDFEMTWGNPANPLYDNPFAYDFDNGTADMDTIEYSSIDGYGRGNTEVLIAPGDSGGPSFFAGTILGIHSFITTLNNDFIAPPNNSSFGELGGDTRVAAFASWIDSITTVPQAGSLLLLASALGLFAAIRRK